ncbi:hypothetical protein [Pontimicrobium sp. SW4]|uniref:Outer membrane protein beta-barrel domain-containing protein n=1 Tax=Pontimicrobium sp. SW4 TaxID=3153519 RepID=A0AAU7BS83_9FLAO
MKNEKKHIDRLFQEGLKNFEASPSLSVWDNVSEQLLNNHKQRKVIPLWMKLSAIAAGLLLLITLGNNIFFQDNNSAPDVNETIVDTEPRNKQNTKNPDSTLDSKTIDSDNVIDAEKLAQEDSNLNENATKKQPSNNIQKNSKNAIINKNESVVANNDKVSTSSKGKLTNKAITNTVASNSNSEKTNEVESQKNSIQKELSKTYDEKSTVANLENSKLNKLRNEEDLSKDEKSTITDAIAENAKVDKKDSDIGKISIEEAIAENNKTKEIEDELTEEEISKRWSLAPNIAPVYFNSLGTGSSMDAEFVNNTKSGEVNMSYGVSASYAINDKINVRVGVNNVKLGYNTHDVFDANDMELNPIKSIATKNIDIDKTPAELAYVTVAGMSFAQVPEPLSNDFNASINQELGFLEIPLEIQYKITNTKLGVNAIGGFSALFLNTNEIYSTLNGNSTLIGKATNINNLSYSANLGLGFNYKVSNNININLEPMFKYQLNTFRNTSGNFKPYFIGVYSGLSFKF